MGGRGLLTQYTETEENPFPGLPVDTLSCGSLEH